MQRVSNFLHRPFTAVVVLAGLALGAFALAHAAEYLSGIKWPTPKAVDPGPPGGPPADAIVLFDGKDMSKWQGADKWKVKDGYVTAGGGSIRTKQAFGDCQLHIEWATPEKVEGSGQGRGNSGVFLMDLYEIQVLDNYKNDTYPDGYAGAVYKEHPPLINACRKPGEWQTYDIVWEAPRFDAAGKLTRPAYVTVLHNGLVVQNHFELTGTTSWDTKSAYRAHPAKLPLGLQYHGNPVRFRNIWIREVDFAAAEPAAK
jgi:hypothetical protein